MKTINLRTVNRFFLLLLFLLPAFAFGQEKTISLERSKKEALAYSNAIKNGKLRIKQSEFAKKQAVFNYFPNVNATGVGLYGIKDFIEPIPIVLPNGFDNFYLAGVMASEVVYAGGKIRKSSKLADLQTKTNRIRAEQSTDSVLLQTQQKYWQLVEIQEQQKALEASKTYLDALLKQQNDLLESGLIAKNQLLQVKTNRSKLVLQQSKVDNKRKLALWDFTLYIGIHYDPDIVADDSLESIIPPKLHYEQPDLELRSNENYRLLQESIEAAKLQTRLAKAELLPQVSVGVAGAEYGTFDNTFKDRFQPIAFGTVKIPISAWWGSDRQKVRQKEIQEEIASNDLRDGQRQLKVGIMRSWYDLLDAYKQIDYAEDNLEYADENLKVLRDNYDSGLKNLSDLLDARQMEQQAQTELIKAKANYEAKETQYLYRTNQLKNPKEKD